MARDPIERLKSALMQQEGQLTESEWRALDAAVLERIEASVAFAKVSPFPALEAVLDDVYAEERPR